MNQKTIIISNSPNDAVQRGEVEWTGPGADLQQTILTAENAEEILRESYLFVPENVMSHKRWPSLAKCGCKYPHHVLKDGILVLSEAGVKNAFRRGRWHINSVGAVKEHIIRHYKDLGIYENSELANEDYVAAHLKNVKDVTIGNSEDRFSDDCDHQLLWYLEKEKLYIESNPNDLSRYLVLFNDQIGRPEFFDSHYSIQEIAQIEAEQEIAQIEAKLEIMLGLILDRARNKIGYAYRMGFDFDTGKRIAVEFELPPYEITNDPASNPHISHVSKPMIVHEIFDSDYHRFESTKMIPDYEPCFVEFAKKIDVKRAASADGEKNNDIDWPVYQKSNIDWLEYQYTMEFQLDFIKLIKQHPKLTVEEYHVGKSDVENKYKSTRLNWRRDIDTGPPLRASEMRRRESNPFRTLVFHYPDWM